MADVEVRGLSKAYGSAVVVDRVDLSIQHRQLLCLLGPSGCGKTTTLRLLAGFVDVDDLSELRGLAAHDGLSQCPSHAISRALGLRTAARAHTT
jgi:ABC-type multidrug transport system ATPase subunit